MFSLPLVVWLAPVQLPLAAHDVAFVLDQARVMLLPSGIVVGLTDNVTVGEEATSDAEQDAVVPPLDPVQVHDHGPVPVTLKGEPVLQRLVVGAEFCAVPLAAPQPPLTTVAARLAEQLALMPPLEPAQVHAQGPEPVTDEAVPVEQRSVVGAELTAVPLTALQTPLTGVGLPPPSEPEDVVSIA